MVTNVNVRRCEGGWGQMATLLSGNCLTYIFLCPNHTFWKKNYLQIVGPERKHKILLQQSGIQMSTEVSGVYVKYNGNGKGGLSSFKEQDFWLFTQNLL